MTNEIKVLSKADRSEGIKALETAGYPTFRSGLGIANGRYIFTTPSSENIYATKAITTSKGNFGLTLIAGHLRGAEDTTKDVNQVYGLLPSDRQFVVTFDQFMIIEPNESYNAEVFNGRLKSIQAVNSDNLVETSEIVTAKRKNTATV